MYTPHLINGLETLLLCPLSVVHLIGGPNVSRPYQISLQKLASHKCPITTISLAKTLVQFNYVFNF